MSGPDTKSSLSAKGVSIAYGGQTVVEELDLTIPSGAFTALIGPNGSGKSTILRALAGLQPIQSGRVLLDDMSISRLSTKEVARRIAVLAQGPIAPEGLTVLDLVRQGRYPHRSMFGGLSEQDDAACAEAIRLTGMEAIAGRLLETLSGGQRQRSWIAMTLAQQSPILLLDEPTTFLDLSHQIEVMELITDLVTSRQKTIVAVLHDLNQASRYASNMVLLKGGRIVAGGSPQAVMTAANMEKVFGVAGVVVPDPVVGSPMFVPGRRSSAATSK